MLAIRLLGRGFSGWSKPLKGNNCLRLFTGVVSGGSGLAVVWKHYHLNAASSKKNLKSPIPPNVTLDSVKKNTISNEKFDWKVFWYYLKPQLWIIAFATAVNSITMIVFQL